MKLGDLEITEEMIDKIICNMENQKERWYINLHDGSLMDEPKMSEKNKFHFGNNFEDVAKDGDAGEPDSCPV